MREIREEKNRLRAKYKAMRKELDPVRKCLWDKKICERLTALVSYRFAHTVLMYAPLDGEVDIMPIFESARAKGKRVAFPKCSSQGSIMDFYYVDDLSELKECAYGIREPSGKGEKFDKSGIGEKSECVCIIPALSFDKTGARIGYGGGFYDRYLTDLVATRLGVVYSSFVEKKHPCGRYDLRVDLIVSEKGAVLVNAQN